MMKKTLIIGCILLCAVAAYAVPAHPGGFVRTLPDGTQQKVFLHGDEFFHWTDTDSIGILPADAQPARAARYAQRPNRAIGTPYLPERGLVILANFKDLKFQKENTRAEMDSMINGKNYTYNGAYKSVREYFYDQSNGQYHPQFDVIGPVELPDSFAYYGANDARGYDQYMGDLVLDACVIADTTFGVDFSQYAKLDGTNVDFVFIYYAGFGENYAGVSADHCWPLQYELKDCDSYINKSKHPNWNTERKRDGVNINMFAISNEIRPSGKREGIGTFCHEFGHVLGLADYYNTDGAGYYNTLPTYWHIMDRGSWNNNGNVPPSYSPFEKFFLGWVTPQLLSKEQLVYTLPADGKTYAYLPKSGAAINPTQYEDTVYYFENRQAEGWDSGIYDFSGPGVSKGMLIWRVVFNKNSWKNNAVNYPKNAPRVTIVPSDGGNTVYNTDVDVYPGRNDVTTRQLFNDWAIYRIKDTDGVITFQIDDSDPTTGWQNPLVSTYRKVLDGEQVRIINPKTNKRYTILGNE